MLTDLCKKFLKLVLVNFTAYSDNGRFVSQDSYRGGGLDDPGQWHLYAYCANNPINYVDPSGHWYGNPFVTKDGAAKNFGKTTNAKSIRENREYISVIYSKKYPYRIGRRVKYRSRYTYVKPVRGGRDGVSVPKPPRGKKRLGLLHMKEVLLIVLAIILCGCSNSYKDSENKVETEKVEIESGIKIYDENEIDCKKLIQKYELPKNVLDDYRIIESEKDAIKLAESVILIVYGNEEKSRFSLEAIYDKEQDVWLVKGQLKDGEVGGVPYIVMRASNGQIVFLSHTK